MLRGYKLCGKPEKGEQGKFAFYFEIDKDIHDQLFTDYCTNDFSKFDNIIVNLKRMLPRY